MTTMRIITLLSLVGVALCTPLGPQLPTTPSHQLVHRENVCAHARSSNKKSCCLQFGLGCTEDILPLYECAGDEVQILAKPFCCTTYKVACAHEGEACASSDACLNDATCVFEDLSSKTLGGTCTKLEENVDDCSVDYCSKKGAGTACIVKELGVTTCGGWHAFQSELGNKICAMPCSKICLADEFKPVASNGQAFCSDCALKMASCESGFDVYGPVDAEGSPEPEMSPEPAEVTCFQRSISKFDAFECCTKFGTFCPKEGEMCSSGGSLTKPPPCDGGLKCVLKSFGYPTLEIADEGTCEKVGEKVVDCGLEFCAKEGAEAVCAVADRNGTMSKCGDWATRSDGVEAANCDFACDLACKEGEGKLMGSDGKSYCNECSLKRTSCVSDFTIYGPVN